MNDADRDRLLEKMADQVDGLDTAIRGTADGSRVGLVARVERLEQHQASAGRLVWITVTGAVTAVMGGVVAWFKSKGN